MDNYTPYSDMKIFHHIDRIEKFMNGERPAPIYIRIKPTNICNQRCYYCGYADDYIFDGREVSRRESIPWEILKRTLYEMREMGVKAVTYSGGGDPLCYSHIGEALELTERLGLDYSMITNGQALDGKAAKILGRSKWVRISLDSASPDTYQEIRGVDAFERVINNIEQFAKQKAADCVLGINCVITQNNANEVYQLYEMGKSLGVNNIKLSPVLIKKEEKDYHSGIREAVEQQIREAKYRLEDDKFRIVDKYTGDLALEECYEKDYKKCYIQNFFAVVAADSKVYRCHQRAYMKVGEIGDLTRKTFGEIWYAHETIDNANQFNPQEVCKMRCAFDERNRLLHDFISIDPNHVNFI